MVLANKLLFNEAMEYKDYSGYLQFYTGNRELEFSEYNDGNVLVNINYTFQADNNQ